MNENITPKNCSDSYIIQELQVETAKQAFTLVCWPLTLSQWVDQAQVSGDLTLKCCFYSRTALRDCISDDSLLPSLPNMLWLFSSLFTAQLDASDWFVLSACLKSMIILSVLAERKRKVFICKDCWCSPGHWACAVPLFQTLACNNLWPWNQSWLFMLGLI